MRKFVQDKITPLPGSPRSIELSLLFLAILKLGGNLQFSKDEVLRAQNTPFCILNIAEGNTNYLSVKPDEMPLNEEMAAAQLAGIEEQFDKINSKINE